MLKRFTILVAIFVIVLTIGLSLVASISHAATSNSEIVQTVRPNQYIDIFWWLRWGQGQGTGEFPWQHRDREITGPIIPIDANDQYQEFSSNRYPAGPVPPLPPSNYKK